MSSERTLRASRTDFGTFFSCQCPAPLLPFDDGFTSDKLNNRESHPPQNPATTTERPTFPAAFKADEGSRMGSRMMINYNAPPIPMIWVCGFQKLLRKKSCVSETQQKMRVGGGGRDGGAWRRGAHLNSADIAQNVIRVLAYGTSFRGSIDRHPPNATDPRPLPRSLSPETKKCEEGFHILLFNRVDALLLAAGWTLTDSVLGCDPNG